MTEAPPASAIASPDSFLSVMEGIVDNLGKEPAPAIQPPTQVQPERQQAPAEEQKQSTEPTEQKSQKRGIDSLLEGSEEDQEPAATQQEDTEDIPENIKDNPKAVAKWGEIKAEKKALERELAQLKSQLSEKSKLQDSDPLKKQAEEYRQKYEELEKEAATWRIEKTQAYRNEVNVPLENIEKEIVEIAKRHEIDPDKMIAAFNEPDHASREKALEELAEFVPQSTRYKLFALNDQTLKVFNRASELQKNAADALRELQEREAQTAEQTKAESKAKQMRAIEENLQKISKVAKNFVLDDQDPQKFIEELKAEASETLFDDLSPEDRAFSVIASTALPKLNKLITALRKENASLKNEISGYGAARPSPSSGQPSIGKADSAADFLSAIGIR